MCTSRSVLEADSEDAWHLPLSLEEGRGPRQAGLLAPDHCRWAPSQGPGLGGSCPRLLGYSDGFAPDSHRLPFFSSPRATYRSFLSCQRVAGITSPKKGDAIIGCCLRSGDARLLEVRFELFDGWNAVDF